jgi:hypothetical protein
VHELVLNEAKISTTILNVSKCVKNRQKIKSETYFLIYRQADVPLQYFLKYVFREYDFTFLCLNTTRLERVLSTIIRTKVGSVK